MHHFGRGKGERLPEKVIEKQARDRAAGQLPLPEKESEKIKIVVLRKLDEAPAYMKGGAASTTDQAPLIPQPVRSSGSLIRDVITVVATVVTTFLVLVGISRDTGQAQTKPQQVKDKTEMAGNLPKGAADEKKAEAKKETLPARVVTAAGSNVIVVGAGWTSVNLSELNIKNFDGTEKTIPINTPEDGWVHYILNKSWSGIIRLIESPVIDPKTGEKKIITEILTTDNGSKIYYPYKYVSDKNGGILIVTGEGLVGWLQKQGIYQELVSQLGIKKMEDVEVSELVISGNKKYILTCSNTSKTVEIYTKDGEIASFKVVNSVPPETLLWRERADSSRPVRADSAVRVPVH
jgi:hypothetical protein